MDKQDFIGMCPTCEKVCKQVGREKGWWQCGNCTWLWEPQDKQDLTDRIKGEEPTYVYQCPTCKGLSKFSYPLENGERVACVTCKTDYVLGEREKMDAVDHPAHYGGDSKYETIKVIEAWGLGFNLGNVVKYISRAGKKGDKQKDLEKALWYLERELGCAKD